MARGRYAGCRDVVETEVEGSDGGEDGGGEEASRMDSG